MSFGEYWFSACQTAWTDAVAIFVAAGAWWGVCAALIGGIGAAGVSAIKSWRREGAMKIAQILAIAIVGAIVVDATVFAAVLVSQLGMYPSRHATSIAQLEEDIRALRKQVGSGLRIIVRGEQERTPDAKLRTRFIIQTSKETSPTDIVIDIRGTASDIICAPGPMATDTSVQHGPGIAACHFGWPPFTPARNVIGTIISDEPIEILGAHLANGD